VGDKASAQLRNGEYVVTSDGGYTTLRGEVATVAAEHVRLIVATLMKLGIICIYVIAKKCGKRALSRRFQGLSTTLYKADTIPSPNNPKGRRHADSSLLCTIAPGKSGGHNYLIGKVTLIMDTGIPVPAIVNLMRLIADNSEDGMHAGKYSDSKVISIIRCLKIGASQDPTREQKQETRDAEVGLQQVSFVPHRFFA